MHTPSIRTLAALAYEHGEEFDPALMLSPALAEQLDSVTAARTTDFAPSSKDQEHRLLESRRRREDIEDIEGDEAFVRETGISNEGLRELEMCPFLDELTRLNHEPLAVIEAACLAEKAGRDQAEA
jgi:hypothetical protein